MFQVELVFSGEGTFTVTFHASEPVTETFGLSRSFHGAPAERVAAQQPPPLVEESGVMWELPLLR
ncbi:hypothetical protein OG535_05235 [Kitasatospora sp. NBC_00085]|uniref:hypothetical protein n=1 Tax=unclassified Kitasatospora TaxID=2633591 RepID=UPI00324670CE